MKFFLRKYSLLVFLLSILFGCKNKNRHLFNLGFEQLDSTGQEVGWTFSGTPGYEIRIDSVIKEKGKYSLNIRGNGGLPEYKIARIVINPPMSGDTLVLSGYIKTRNVSEAAVLWMQTNGYDGQILAIDNMRNRKVTGTNDWKKYILKLPYNTKDTKKITLGALLVGKGQIWIDNFSLTIDGKSIADVPLKSIFDKEIVDTDATKASSFLNEKLSNEKIKVLTNFGMIWGFLKYYHPAVTSGKYNWDKELFLMLPKIMQTSNSADAYRIIENWIDSLGPVPACNHCNVISKNKIKFPPDFGYLFLKNNLPESLVKKLAYIRDNYSQPTHDYYVSFARAGNPEFKHEIIYDNSPYPDAALRLLSLYRYWNIIQYFYPNRYLIKEDWNKALTEFIPKFIDAKNKYEYIKACLELIAVVHDTHANIWGYNPTLDTLKGVMMAPFKARFVDGKLVVDGYYQSTPAIKDEIKIGDIVEEINGITIDSLVRKFLPLTPASNLSRQLRDMASDYGFLLRTNQADIHVEVKDKHHSNDFVFKTITMYAGEFKDEVGDSLHEKGYQLLKGSIGYIYPAKLKANDIDSIIKLFKNTKGIIIDLRCYPSTFMPFTYGDWLKQESTPFVSSTFCSLTYPGIIVYGQTVSNGGGYVNHYKGKVVILVNSSTLSQAEYTTMALSTTTGSVVIGSQTAGADGNVSSIDLPGGIHTMISGMGVYYPDSTQTQQVGVKINVEVKPTIQSIKDGEDLPLKKAMDIIENKEVVSSHRDKN